MPSKPLSYATPTQPAATFFDPLAWRSFYLALLFAPLVVVIGPMGILVATIIHSLLLSAVPNMCANLIGAVTGGFLVMLIPLRGLIYGVRAIRAHRRTPATNLWQAITGVVLNSIYILVVSFVTATASGIEHF